MKKRILSILTLLCLLVSLMPTEALAVPVDPPPPPPTYPVYSYGTRIMLTDNSVWLVLEDPGSGSAQFTLVMDGFLAGTCSRAAVDTALSDYQTTARLVFSDPGAQTRLPTQDEVSDLRDINSFLNQNTVYWLPDNAEGRYSCAQGNSSFISYLPAYAESIALTSSLRPVLTVFKTAILRIEPMISAQPPDRDLMVLDGEDAVFSVTASGINLTFQWQVKEDAVWTDIQGAEGAVLTIPESNENYALGKTFRCKLDSDWGVPVYSGEAKLVVYDWQQYGAASASAGTDYTTDGNTFTIHTAAGLGWLASQVNDGEGNNFSGKTVLLDRDIDLASRVFIPIGNRNSRHFDGHFDGGMHTVSGMTAKGNYYYCGLFGLAKDALIENLLIADGSVSFVTNDWGSDFYAGALCGYGNNTSFRNVGVGPVTVSARDDGNSYQLGGMIGYLRDVNADTGVSNCYSRAEITGYSSSSESYAGGIAGKVGDDKIANCYFAGRIGGTPTSSGGIAVVTEFTSGSAISNCFWQTDDGIPCAYYGFDESDNIIAENTGCAPLEEAQMKSAATVTALNAWAAAGNTASGTSVYEMWGAKSTVNGGYPVFKAFLPTASPGGGSSPPARTIAVTEVNAPLFGGRAGAVKATADMNSAFSASVEVKVTDTDEDGASFFLGAGQTAYPFDISLYLKGTKTRVQPKEGYTVTISLPIPDDLLDVKGQLSIAHKADDGRVTTIASQLKQINGVWYLVFEATEFSPYALVVNGTGAYNETAGLPYYVDSEGNEVFIGFAANGKYVAPFSVKVLFKENPKSFTDTGSHWAKNFIEFVTEREIFLGTGSDAFSPYSGMTRAMFATVIGRLYERSYGEIETMSTHAFADCDYGEYYGRYVDWAAENGILGGYGNGKFGPGDPVTREQMAAILFRFAKFFGVMPDDMDTALTYPDAGIISSWAQSAALYCQSSGIITGRDGGSFVPQGTATRAEVAVILERFIKNILG